MLRSRFTIGLVAVVGLIATSFAPPVATAEEDTATLEIHYRPCGTIPPDDVSWFDHCHDGPNRSGIQAGGTALWQPARGELLNVDIDGNGDSVVTVAAGEYQYLHPPFHHARDFFVHCSFVDADGNVLEDIQEPTKPIAVQPGQHVVCDTFVVWGASAAGLMPPADDEPQATIDVRWRACTEVPADDNWFEECFEAESPLGTEPQEGRLITLTSPEQGGPPQDASTDADGNARLVVPPGEYQVQTMTGDFVAGDYLYCSIVDANERATETDIPSDPITVTDGEHVICDYFYVANEQHGP